MTSQIWFNGRDDSPAVIIVDEGNGHFLTSFYAAEKCTNGNETISEREMMVHAPAPDYDTAKRLALSVLFHKN